MLNTPTSNLSIHVYLITLSLISFFCLFFQLFLSKNETSIKAIKSIYNSIFISINFILIGSIFRFTYYSNQYIPASFLINTIALTICFFCNVAITHSWVELTYNTRRSDSKELDEIIWYSSRKMLNRVNFTRKVDLSRKRKFAVFWVILTLLSLTTWISYNPNKTIVSVVINILIVVFFFRYFDLFLVRKPKENLKGIHYSIKYLILAAVLFSCLILLPDMIPVQSQLLLFLMLISIDDIIKGLLHFKQKILRISVEKLESEHRWLISVPLLLVISLVGGLITFSFYSRDGLTNTLWIEVCGGVIVYLIIRPVLEATDVRLIENMKSILKAEYREYLNQIPVKILRNVEANLIKPHKSKPRRGLFNRMFWHVRDRMARGTEIQKQQMYTIIEEEGRAVSSYFSALITPLAITCFIGSIMFDYIRPLVESKSFSNFSNIGVIFIGWVTTWILLRTSETDYQVTKDIFRPAEKFLYITTAVIGVIPSIMLAGIGIINLYFPSSNGGIILQEIKLLSWEALFIIVLPIQIVFIQSLNYIRSSLNSLVTNLGIIIPSLVNTRNLRKAR